VADNEAPSDVPEVVTSYLQVGGPDEDVLLYEGSLLVEGGGQSMEFEGTLQYRWRPRPGLYFEGLRDPLTEDDIPVVLGWPKDALSIPSLGATAPIASVLEFTPTMGTNPRARVFGILDLVDVGDSADLRSGLFLEVNFLDLIGSQVKTGDSIWRGRIILRGGGWAVTLDARQDHSAIVRKLRRSGGYAVTHTAEARRSNGHPFSPQQFIELTQNLHSLLSFAAGRWAPPILLTGLDEHGEAVWNRWSSPRIDPWRGRFSWCDSFHWGHCRRRSGRGWTFLSSRFGPRCCVWRSDAISPPTIPTLSSRQSTRPNRAWSFWAGLVSWRICSSFRPTTGAIV
jgi:hypothetical protein